jgi:hypothetical protein
MVIPHFGAGHQRVTHPFATISQSEDEKSYDLHVSSTPPAFILSQDQTLRKVSSSNPLAALKILDVTQTHLPSCHFSVVKVPVRTHKTDDLRRRRRQRDLWGLNALFGSMPPFFLSLDLLPKGARSAYPQPHPLLYHRVFMLSSPGAVFCFSSPQQRRLSYHTFLFLSTPQPRF